LDTWYGRTVVKSCSRLSYDDVQSVIDANELPTGVELHGQGGADVQEDVKMLYALSKQLRDSRFQDGSLSINPIKLLFKLDSSGQATGVSVYEEKESHQLVQEFMFLANISVAQKICVQFPEYALLRRHGPPLERRMTEFLKHCEMLGYQLDCSSARALNASFEAIERKEARDIITLLAYKCMQPAKYFCTGTLDINKYQHFALNAPLYTHFTSPLHRYADIIVHRQLESALLGDKRFYLERDIVQKTAQHCNIKKEGAKSAQAQSNHLHLSRYFNGLSGPIVRDAVVVAVLDSAFDVLVPGYGIEKRVHVDILPLEGFQFNEETGTLHLVWKQGVAVTELVDGKKEPGDNYVDDDEEGDVDEDAMFMEELEETQQPEPIEPATPGPLQREDPMGFQMAESMKKLAIESSSSRFEVTTVETREEMPVVVNRREAPAAERETLLNTTAHMPLVPKSRVVPSEDNEPSAANAQTICVFSRIRVIINVEITKSPPIIKVLAANPFM